MSSRRRTRRFASPAPLTSALWEGATWAAVLLASTAPAQVLLDGGGRPGGVALSALAAAMALALLAARGRASVFAVLRTAWPFLAAVGMMGLLSLGAVDSRWSLVRWLGWLPCVVTSFAAACALTPSRFVSVVLAVLGVAVSLSLGLELLHPLPRIDPSAQRDGWAGLYPTKNILGPVAGLTLALALTCGPSGWRGRAVRAAVVAAGLACLFGARSLSGWAIAASLVLLGWAMTRLRGWTRLSVLIAFGTSAAVLAGKADAWLGLVGKASGLNGRAAIWDSVWSEAMQRPLAGAGFNYSGSAEMAAKLRESFGVYSVHSAYLDAFLCLGAPLAVFSAGALAYPAWRAWRVRSEQGGQRTFATLLSIGCCSRRSRSRR